MSDLLLFMGPRPGTRTSHAPSPVLWTFQHTAPGESAIGWQLDGEVWPDPAGCRQSIGIAVELEVIETWRTGGLFDAMRSVVPASVVGKFSETTAAQDLLIERTTLVKRDSELREVIAAKLQGKRRLAARRRAQLCDVASLFRPVDRRDSPSRLLVAPFEHPGADRAPAGLAEQLDHLLAKLQTEQLTDVVRFEGGPLLHFRVLALLHRKMVVTGLYGARAFDVEGREIGVDLRIDLITDFTQLPASWRDVAGPWFDEVHMSMALLELASAGSPCVPRADWHLALCEFELAGPARAIEFGVQPLTQAFRDFGLVYPAYLIAVMEGLAAAGLEPWLWCQFPRSDERHHFYEDPIILVFDTHERAELELHMQPQREYVFDVEAPSGAIEQPLYRQRIATSRYANCEAMANDLRRSYIADRRVPNPEALLALATLAPDESFDAALVDAGLGVEARPGIPRVTILWNDASPATPIAILLDTPEPLWRTRLEPEPLRAGDGRVIAWELVPKPWLEVEEMIAADGPRVARFVRDSSGYRTLIVLEPNARGRTVSLGLVRNTHPLIDPDAVDGPLPMLEVFLERAPWEVSP